MSVQVSCPYCRTQQSVEGRQPGTVFECVNCKKPLRVPLPAQTPVPPPQVDVVDEVVPVEPPRLPASVRTAGVLWIVFGSALLLNLGINLMSTFLLAPKGRDPAKDASLLIAASCASMLVGLFAAAFIFIGIQTARGAAHDTLGNSIGSMIFGVLQLAAAVYRGANGDFIGLVICAFACIGLFTAGILALIGREAYKEYRQFRNPVRRRRRRGCED